jgi:hypothetical protein
MKKIILSIFILLFGFQSKAQQIIISEDDAANFLESYFSPIGESLGAGLNNGWYNTAKPHKLGGFDITLTLNAVSVPNEIQHFDPNTIPNFSSNETITPTILGSNEGATITYNNPNSNPVEFTMPDQGILKINLIPVPMINAGIGLIKKTELDFRYLPTYNFDMGFVGKGSVGLWGIGAKHDLLQYIPVVGDAIPMSLSIQAGHTRFNTSFSVVDPNSSVNQDVSLDINSTTINLIASKKLLMLTAYAGVGYNSSVTTFSSETSFNVGTSTSPATMNIPLEMKFESQNEMRANIGLRFNLAIIALQANHTFSKYPVTTVGVGLIFR